MILLSHICPPDQLIRGGEVVEPARVPHWKAVVVATAREDALVYIAAGGVPLNPYTQARTRQVWVDAFHGERLDHGQVVRALS